MATLTDQLTEYGASAVESIRESIRTKPATRFGPVNASGNLADSLRFEVTENPDGATLYLYAAGYALTAEFGRRPGKFPSLLRIQQWIEDKGIIPKPGVNGKTVSAKPGEGKEYSTLAYLIGRKIANSGTTLYEQGKPSGVFGDTLQGPITTELYKKLLPFLVQRVVSAVQAVQ